MKLSDIKKEWSKYIVLHDEYVIDVVLATIIGNMLIDRDPIWTMIVAPSSGGKSTVIAPCIDIPNNHFVDDLTEKTLLSGYKVKGKDSSLLKLIGSGMMLFSDFTSILSKNIVSRGEILSQLKLVYDRKVSKYTGTGGVMWEGKIGVIAAATPDIYFHLEAGRSMGERFIYYWLNIPTDEEVADKQSQTSISAKDMTDIMKEFYKDYFYSIKEWIKANDPPVLKMTDDQRYRVRKASMFCVAGKATVHTNFKTGKVDQIPHKASVGRDNKAFEALLLTLQVMYAHETNNKKASVQDYMIEIVEKCAYSSINRERRAILEILANATEEMTASQIGATNNLGLERDGVAQYLAPLFAVGIIKRHILGNHFKWYIENKDYKDFILRVSTSVPQIKFKEEEDDDMNAEEIFNNY